MQPINSRKFKMTMTIAITNWTTNITISINKTRMRARLSTLFEGSWERERENILTNCSNDLLRLRVTRSSAQRNQFKAQFIHIYCTVHSTSSYFFLFFCLSTLFRRCVLLNYCAQQHLLRRFHFDNIFVWKVGFNGCTRYGLI